MKTDALTIGAVGFAAFAAWAYFKRTKPALTGQNVAVQSAVDQRRAVGDAIGQNTDYLYSLFGYEIAPVTNMGGAQGLHV